jgi:hypothetical protein
MGCPIPLRIPSVTTIQDVRSAESGSLICAVELEISAFASALAS